MPIIIFLLSLLALLPAGAYASTVNLNLPAVGGLTPGSTPASVVTYFFVLATALVGAIGLLALLAGGVTYLTSAGNPQLRNEARDRVQNALLGLLVVLAAVVLLYTINPDLVKLRNPNLLLVQLPPPVSLPPGVADTGCRLLAARWDRGQVCRVGDVYESATLVVQGRDCVRWGASLSVVNRSSGRTVQTLSGSFDASDILSVRWNPADQSGSAVDGRYYFEAIVGSGGSESRVASGDLVVASQGSCAAERECYHGPGGCWPGFRCNDGVWAQIARQEAAPALYQLAVCIAEKLARAGRSDVGRITSISDNSGGECIDPAHYPWAQRPLPNGQVLRQCGGETCDPRDGSRNGACCAHAENSCHYGGRTCRGRSYAVDFGLARESADTCSVLHRAVIDCNRQLGGRAWFHFEGDHLHVSIGAQHGCGCDMAGGCTPGQAGPYVSDWCSGEQRLCCDQNGNVVPCSAQP